jgi:hypothetical protein
MKSTRRTIFAVALLAAAATLPVAAQTIRGGNDGWQTPGGGQTTIDLSAYPDVLGSPLADGPKISLKGKPLNPEKLGSIDTLLERGKTTISDFGTGSATLRVVALSLESESDFKLKDGRVFHLDITLSQDAERLGKGRITLTKANSDGGTFSSSFPVLVKLAFTNVETGDVLTVDCGLSEGCPDNKVSSTNSAWSTALGGKFNPAEKGVTPIPSGIAVQGYKTIGSNTDFTPGFTASAEAGFPVATISEADRWAMHQVGPAQDCLGSSSTAARNKAVTVPAPSTCPKQ